MLHILRILIYIYTLITYIYIFHNIYIYSSLSWSIRLWTTNKHIPWSRTSVVAKNVRPHIHFAVNLYKDYDSRRGIWPGGLPSLNLVVWWKTRSGWWFGTFVIFPNSWDGDPIWLSYFSGGVKPPISDDIDYRIGFSGTSFSIMFPINHPRCITWCFHHVS